MVSVLTSSVVDYGIEALSGQTKDYKIGMCCFSAKQAALIRIMCPEWNNMFTHRLHAYVVSVS